MIPGVFAASLRRRSPIDVVDPHFASVTSLAHFDGHDDDGGVMTFEDVVPGRNWAVVGIGVRIDSELALFGRGSLSLGGSGGLRSNVVAGSNFGGLDFTVELWLRVTAAGSGNRYVFDGRHTGIGNGTGLTLYVSSSTTLWVGAASSRAVGTVPSGSWCHVAAARKEGVLRTFIDGVQLDEQIDTRDYTGGQIIYLGQTLQNSQRITGHMDDLRVTRGVARYTEPFARPSRPFPTR